MKREIWIGTLLYFLSTLILFDLLIDFSFSPFFLFWLLLSFVFGYIFSSYMFSLKQNLDENLLHITKEILHELNIPLSTIKANTNLIKRTLSNNQKDLKRLSRIEDASIRLERLYKELVYSIKKEIHPIEKEIFALDLLIQERVENFGLLERNLFELNLSPLTVRVDKIGFEKSIDNLISNAMKYSPKESAIQISLIGEELIIQDFGIGMDETELVRIFERYYQLDSQKHGEGIGLALVKEYCDSEGIMVSINSQKGRGTKVMLDLRKVMV
jgi:signal transduction histidine kinase